MTNIENKDILEKVKKLLALASSSNEHEASLATNKAQELLTRYNLSMQSLDTMSEYEKVTLANEPYKKPHQSYIIYILEEYFFVEVVTFKERTGDRTIDGRRKYRYNINMAGTATNVQVAEFVFAFLSVTYMSLWLQYKREKGVGESHRISFYAGLTNGLREKLSATLKKVENETGLVVIKDPNIIKEFGDNIKTKSVSTRVIGATMADGHEKGKNINIAKPIGGSSTSSGKLID